MNWLDARVINSVPMSSSTVAVIAYSHISRELKNPKNQSKNLTLITSMISGLGMAGAENGWVEVKGVYQY